MASGEGSGEGRDRRPSDQESSSKLSRGYSTFEPLQPGPPSTSLEDSQELLSPSARKSRPRLSKVDSRTADRSPDANQLTLSPDTSGRLTVSKPRAKRAVSHYAYKGAEFSVDDDESEVEEDMARSRASRSSMRRRPTTLRRRNTSLMAGAAPVNIESVLEDPPEPAEQDFAEIEADESTPEPEGETPMDEDGGNVSDAESFTLKDRQEAINETHPFGIRIWKPAIYKKDRSVQKKAEGDIHSIPGDHVSSWLFLANIIWILVFGIWLSLISFVGAVVCFLFGFTASGYEYGKVLWGLAGFFIYPFGMFVSLEQDEAYMDEDEGEGRSISEYEQWQTGDLEEGRLFFGPTERRTLVGRRRNSLESAHETDSLLGRGRHDEPEDMEERIRKRRLFGRGEWNIGRIIFFLFFYGLIAPLILFVSLINWLLVFTIPMAKVTSLLFYHLRRRPLALSFHSDSTYARVPGSSSSILLCTYRAVGWKYYKYTIDGTNIFFINLMAVVALTVFDYFVLYEWLEIKIALTHPGVLFTLSLASVIPLAYFIGQAVASISAQSSMGLGAAINAFFSTIVEVYLYCVALKEGKGRLVEGSIVGSILAGILVMPGLSMCFGAIVRKTQRFNAKSAGVTSTMLLFGVIAAFGPTLFYQIYGTYELQCRLCSSAETTAPFVPPNTCKRCSFAQIPALDDRFYHEAVKPFCYIAAVLLFVSYVIGLWFTLRTHAAVIWNTPENTKKTPSGPSIEASVLTGRESIMPPSVHRMSRKDSHHTPKDTETLRDPAEIRDSPLYRRILNESLNSAGISAHTEEPAASKNGETVHLPPPKSAGADGTHVVQIPGLSNAANEVLAREVAELAATAATVAAQEATRQRRRVSVVGIPRVPVHHEDGENQDAASHVGGGHDAPNWSRLKSTVILLGATILYAIVAEILVSTVDVVLQNVSIEEKFLGITLFALVPNTTEFLNAISFAMNGNIALSMEIGSAYALQVCLLQVPALVAYSAFTESYFDKAALADHVFSLIFPQWDLVTVILCVFLLSYMYTEGKSNYFKGSILLLSYLVVITGFYLSKAADPSIGASNIGLGYEEMQAVAWGSRNRPHAFDL